jgi:hypothetical protein
MCENRLDSYFKKEKGAYENYPSYQFFSKEKKNGSQPWWFLINLRTIDFFDRFSSARSQEFQYSFLEKLVFNIIIFDKIIKFEYIFSSFKFTISSLSKAFSKCSNSSSRFASTPISFKRLEGDLQPTLQPIGPILVCKN